MMQTATKQKIEGKIKVLTAKLGSMKPSDDEYKATLGALERLTKVYDTLSKTEVEEFNVSMREREVMLKEDELNLKRKEFSLKENESKLQEQKLADDKAEREKTSKRQMVMSIVGIAVPAFTTIATTVIGLTVYNRMAIRALNMEYIDNSITPRSFNDCMNSVKQYAKK